MCADWDEVRYNAFCEVSLLSAREREGRVLERKDRVREGVRK